MQSTFHFTKKGKKTMENKKTESIDFATGCCMLIKSDVFKKIGFFDEDYFLTYEDVDFCLRAKDAGFKIDYIPSSIIYHKVAQSMGKRTETSLYYHMRNELLFRKKRRLKHPYFWPWYILKVNQRFWGSLATGKLKNAIAVLKGVRDGIKNN